MQSEVSPGKHQLMMQTNPLICPLVIDFPHIAEITKQTTAELLSSEKPTIDYCEMIKRASRLIWIILYSYLSDVHGQNHHTEDINTMHKVLRSSL